MTGGFGDPRVSVHYADARFFVKRAKSRYDVVIVGVPDPTTAQLNRFYTAEFMEEAGRVLGDDGVIGLAVQSAENYIGPELAAYLSCLEETARSVFDAVVVLPGDPCHIVATRSGTALTRDPRELSARVRERSLEVAFVRDYYLLDRLSGDRTALLDAALDGATARVNADLSPAAYYLSMVLWNRQFSGVPRLLLAAPELLTVRGALVASLVLAALLAAPALAARRGAPGSPAVVAAVTIVGATEMSLEITALLAFQSIYGYVYHQLALIVAAFMAGLALGGWLGTRAASRGAGAGAFTVLQLFITMVPLALAFALVRMARLPPNALRAWAGLFPLVVVGAALLAGLQFPLAARLVSRGRSDVGAVGGRLYGADLLGAAVGAIGTAVFLLPIMGTVGAMRALSMMNAAVLVSLVLALARSRWLART
jgi:spermidine synthase